MEWIVLCVVAYLFYSYRKNKNKSNSSKSSGITLQYGYSDTSNISRPVKSKNTSKGRWIKPNEEITIGAKTIRNGLFYYGGILNGENYSETESSLVDDKLKINDTQYTFTDESFGYWPSFQSLSPLCRGAYIDWLASNRDMPDVPIGYLFLYFYGLERRIIKDYKDGSVSDAECTEICQEIIRLRRIFKDNYETVR